mmetsp:Transcript_37644/g.42400  ORF Transcript_37644/g.42400 Transcript_37644/m.42400 type:complete len:247 (-) Transcript_37644:60-800(-)
MSRRSSSRQQAAAAASLEKKSSLPPNVERGLFSLVEGNEHTVASMLSIDIKKLEEETKEKKKKEKMETEDNNDSNNNDTDNNVHLLTTSLCSSMIDCMQTNQLSVEAFLTRFFDVSILRKYCHNRLHVSGKGNEATLAARIGRIWSTKPNAGVQQVVGTGNKKHPKKDDDAVGDASKKKPRVPTARKKRQQSSKHKRSTTATSTSQRWSRNSGRSLVNAGVDEILRELEEEEEKKKEEEKRKSQHL